jgi:hypothetical protein
MGRERDTGRRSDIRAQRVGMIPCFPSQDLIRLRKLNDSRRLWVGNHQDSSDGWRKLLVLCFGVLKTGRPFDAAIAMGG